MPMAREARRRRGAVKLMVDGYWTLYLKADLLTVRYDEGYMHCCRVYGMIGVMM